LSNESTLQKNRSRDYRHRSCGDRTGGSAPASYLAGQCRSPQNTGYPGKGTAGADQFLTVNGVSVAVLNGGAPGHRIELGMITVNTRWNAILRGALVASLHVDAPQLLFNAVGIRGIHHGDGKTQKNQLDKSEPSWQEKLTRLPRFKVASAILTDGEIRVVGAPGERGASLGRLPESACG
jgi:hypothetical protein